MTKTSLFTSTLTAHLQLKVLHQPSFLEVHMTFLYNQYTVGIYIISRQGKWLNDSFRFYGTFNFLRPDVIQWYIPSSIGGMQSSKKLVSLTVIILNYLQAF